VTGHTYFNTALFSSLFPAVWLFWQIPLRLFPSQTYIKYLVTKKNLQVLSISRTSRHRNCILMKFWEYFDLREWKSNRIAQNFIQNSFLVLRFTNYELNNKIKEVETNGTNQDSWGGRWKNIQIMFIKPERIKSLWIPRVDKRIILKLT
jgi:hypothetical protein